MEDAEVGSTLLHVQTGSMLDRKAEDGQVRGWAEFESRRT